MTVDPEAAANQMPFSEKEREEMGEGVGRGKEAAKVRVRKW